MIRFFVLALALAIGPALAQPSAILTREAPLIGARGEKIGQVTVRGSANATVIRIAVTPGGLSPGWHGVALYSVGDCSDPGQFLLAKGIIDHLVKNHGLLHPDGPKEGDLPNIHANPDGSANAEVSSHAVRMLGQTGLVEGDRSALIVHANPDDHITQPNGDAGARVACAELK
jgi:superoxide dismutase, Cu-Zn family